MSDLIEPTIADINVGGMVQFQDRRIARFENVPTQNMVKSVEAGRPVYESKIVLFVRHPGERDETAVAMQPYHEFEFPRAWAAFQAGQKVDPDGTPLAVLFPAEPHIIAHLRALHIFTVEALAECGEGGIARIGMGAREYVARAVKFIESATAAAPMAKVQHELQQRDAEIAALKDQVQALIDAGRRRGRKSNEGDDE